MDLCPTCRKLIYRTDPCKGVDIECGRTDGGSKKSAAARIDVPRTEVVVAQGGVRLPKATGSTPRAVGTKRKAVEAPPVDTSKLIVAVDYGRQDETAELIGKVMPDGNVQVLSLTVRGTPRIRKPKGTFDRKAYQRKAARDRRAKQKAGK